MKIFHLVLTTVFICSNLSAGTPPVWAAGQTFAPASLTGALSTDPYHPPRLLGITLFPENPLRMDFLIDTGDEDLRGDALREESRKLIDYFVTALTVPEEELWVNLSPLEPDRIIADGLSRTGMGRDMLTQDYQLKRMVSAYLTPDHEAGREFWERIYSATEGMEIPENLHSRVWILPESATVRVNGRTASVSSAKMKVMLEEDGDEHSPPEPRDSAAMEAMREVIVPAIEREVNEGRAFAPLRQIYHALILSSWYKKNLKNSFLQTAYINRNRVDGSAHNEPEMKERLYERYLEAFREGMATIREEYNPATGTVQTRQYVTGGERFSGMARMLRQENGGGQPQANGRMVAVGAELEPVGGSRRRQPLLDPAQLAMPDPFGSDSRFANFVEDGWTEDLGRMWDVDEEARDRMLSALQAMYRDHPEGFFEALKWFAGNLTRAPRDKQTGELILQARYVLEESTPVFRALSDANIAFSGNFPHSVSAVFQSALAGLLTVTEPLQGLELFQTIAALGLPVDVTYAMPVLNKAGVHQDVRIGNVSSEDGFSLYLTLLNPRSREITRLKGTEVKNIFVRLGQETFSLPTVFLPGPVDAVDTYERFAEQNARIQVRYLATQSDGTMRIAATEEADISNITRVESLSLIHFGDGDDEIVVDVSEIRDIIRINGQKTVDLAQLAPEAAVLSRRLVIGTVLVGLAGGAVFYNFILPEWRDFWSELFPTEIAARAGDEIFELTGKALVRTETEQSLVIPLSPDVRLMISPEMVPDGATVELSVSVPEGAARVEAGIVTARNPENYRSFDEADAQGGDPVSLSFDADIPVGEVYYPQIRVHVFGEKMDALPEVEGIVFNRGEGSDPAALNPGGIDFNPRALAISEEGDASRVETDFANFFQSMGPIPPDIITGLRPVIRSISPVPVLH